MELIVPPLPIIPPPVPLPVIPAPADAVGTGGAWLLAAVIHSPVTSVYSRSALVVG